MTGPAPTSLLAKIVLPHGDFEPAGHVVVSRWEAEPSGTARFDLYPQERADAEELFTRLTIVPSVGDPPVAVVLVDGPSFEGPLRDVAVHQGLHGVSFTVELALAEASPPEPSPTVESDREASARRRLAEALRPFVTLRQASERDADDVTLDGVRVGHVRALVDAAMAAGLVDPPAAQRAPIVPGGGT